MENIILHLYFYLIKMNLKHEELIKKHLGINTPNWIMNNVQGLIDELLSKKLFSTDELILFMESARDRGNRHGDILWDYWLNEKLKLNTNENCIFFPDNTTTSQTKCSTCGKEKWQHLKPYSNEIV